MKRNESFLSNFMNKKNSREVMEETPRIDILRWGIFYLCEEIENQEFVLGSEPTYSLHDAKTRVLTREYHTSYLKNFCIELDPEEPENSAFLKIDNTSDPPRILEKPLIDQMFLAEKQLSEYINEDELDYIHRAFENYHSLPF